MKSTSFVASKEPEPSSHKVRELPEIKDFRHVFWTCPKSQFSMSQKQCFTIQKIRKPLFVVCFLLIFWKYQCTFNGIFNIILLFIDDECMVSVLATSVSIRWGLDIRLHVTCVYGLSTDYPRVSQRLWERCSQKFWEHCSQMFWEHSTLRYYHCIWSSLFCTSCGTPCAPLLKPYSLCIIKVNTVSAATLRSQNHHLPEQDSRRNPWIYGQPCCGFWKVIFMF